MDSLKFYPGPPCLTLLISVPCRRATPVTALQPFQGWSARRASTCSRLLPLPTPYAVRLCLWPSSGAEANARGLDDDTPLHDAAMNGHEKLVKLLLTRGADPKQTNAKGKTPLDATPSIKPNIKALLTVSSMIRRTLNVQYSTVEYSTVEGH
jgi:hypothetical protein